MTEGEPEQQKLLSSRRQLLGMGASGGALLAAGALWPGQAEAATEDGRRGELSDRNVELLLPAPFELAGR